MSELVTPQRDREERYELLVAAARQFDEAGCCVLPVATDGTKAPRPPGGKWKRYQRERPELSQLDVWLRHVDGIGIVCGAISGQLEMFEFEGRAVDENLHGTLCELCDAAGLAHVWSQLWSGYRECTPSGGLHLLYRTEGPARSNVKLARRAATDEELATNPDDRVKVQIETRGEGGFVVVHPSGGRTHPTGRGWGLIAGGPASIPTITCEERDTLYALAASLDQLPPRDKPVHTRARSDSNGDRPGDTYSATHTWADVLEPHGWVCVSEIDGEQHWRRPGKEHGSISATTNYAGSDLLYVFSTSAAPFEPERGYSKFAAYALLEHGGDFTAAANALAPTPKPVAQSSSKNGARAKQGEPSAQPKGLVRQASTVKLARTEWLWQRRLPRGSLVVFDGDPGEGKSNISLDIAAHVTTGSPWPDDSGMPPKGDVVLLSAEDDPERTVIPRLRAAGADLSRVWIYDATLDTEGKPHPAVIPEDLAALADVIREHDAIAVVIDPLMAYLAGRIDSHRDQDVRRALAQLAAVAAETGATIIVIRHLNKSSDGNALYRGGGSIGIIAAARAGMIVTKHPTDPQLRALGEHKHNLAPEPPPLAYRLVADELYDCSRIEWCGEIDSSADQLLAQHSQRDDVSSSVLEDRCRVLRQILGDGDEHKVQEIKEDVKQLGLTIRAFDDAKATLHVRSIKHGKPGDDEQFWAWRLPPKAHEDPRRYGDSETPGLREPSACLRNEPEEPNDGGPSGDATHTADEPADPCAPW
jgi:hypothetical protein